ncbi:MAG: response regulator [Gallionellaceae bacterium]|nr:response regulator [Gallionellaceae bacterium]
MKFLVVEDDLDMARYIATILDSEGIGSDIAGSGELARNLFIRDHFDALIIDGILPGESGISLVMGLRELRSDVPVLFCTGATDEFNKKLMGSLGQVCHKPLDENFPLTIRKFVQSFASSQ